MVIVNYEDFEYLNFPHFLTGKQKTKKVREIQNIQILLVSMYNHFLQYLCFKGHQKTAGLFAD